RIRGSTRRALNVRDGGCRWPGCDRPASYTSGHHLKHWIRGGATDLPNLVLLCHRHHWMVHEGKWQIVRTDVGQFVTVPPQMDIFGSLVAGRIRMWPERSGVTRSVGLGQSRAEAVDVVGRHAGRLQVAFDPAPPAIH